MVPLENKSNSFVVTLTPITESSDLTIQSDHTDMEREKQDRTFPEEDKLFEKPKKKLTTKELPKSFRVSLETHTAISTLATIEDMKIYEVINMLIEEKVAALPAPKQNLVRNAVKQVLEVKKSQE
ncbi:TPA: hypothetical protein QCY64_004660 [Bacillus cereus]|nr:hypothetical protein COD63_29795 [Bacillus thuringiensis]HDR8009329.1 hypothetical protein [Bacillus cereus]HDR8155523.1 hypothetical protein [Bacillus cereus]HDR8502374.1 hypothetical protein [Bacillus cereus]